MSDAWLRWLTMSAMVLLVLHAVGSWVHSVLGITAAIASAALVVALSVLSARMAALGDGNHAWFVVPTILFTALPLAAKLLSVLTAEHGWWARIVDLAPFLLGFAAPVLILLTVYLELGRRARRSAPGRAVPVLLQQRGALRG